MTKTADELNEQAGISIRVEPKWQKYKVEKVNDKLIKKTVEPYIENEYIVKLYINKVYLETRIVKDINDNIETLNSFLTEYIKEVKEKFICLRDNDPFLNKSLDSIKNMTNKEIEERTKSIMALKNKMITELKGEVK